MPFVPFVANFFLRFRIRELLVILLNQFLITGRDLIFLRRPDIVFREQDLKRLAQLEFDTLEWIDDLLQLVDRSRIARKSRVVDGCLYISSNLIEPLRERISRSELVLDVPNIGQTLLQFFNSLTG